MKVIKRVENTEQNKVHFQTEMDSSKTPLKLENEGFFNKHEQMLFKVK